MAELLYQTANGRAHVTREGDSIMINVMVPKGRAYRLDKFRAQSLEHARQRADRLAG